MNNQLTSYIHNIQITMDNILEIIDNKIRENAPQADLYMCRIILFQFFQVKYKNLKNIDYVGYILYGNRKGQQITYSLDVTDIGTLNNAGVLSEVFEIEYNDDYYDLLIDFYSEQQLNQKFRQIIEINNIICSDLNDNYVMFNDIKNYNSDLFRTYQKKVLNKNGTISRARRFNQNAYFHFRFFRLSEEFAPYENILWEALKEQFPHRLMIPLVRGK
ncbi:hypothetical protein J6O48_09085 [bacterium]|nr:hypothetical protein [bacterium]